MKALFIGGTGTISIAITRMLAQDPNWELTILNRGKTKAEIPKGVNVITADINDKNAVLDALGEKRFDVIANFIVYTKEEMARDIRLFTGRMDQYILISTCATYQKPPKSFVIDEASPQHNPFWDYGSKKIEAEACARNAYREEAFPVTIVRACHVYGGKSVPTPMHGKGYWNVLSRIVRGKPVIVPGDGNVSRQVMHHVDFAKAFVGIMGNDKTIGQAMNITSDEILTWDEILDTIGQALGKKVNKLHIGTDMLVKMDPSLSGPLWGDKSVNCVFSNNKVKRYVPGFIPAVSAYQGIRQAVGYYLAHPEEQVEDPAFDAYCDKIVGACQKCMALVEKEFQ